MAAARPSTNTGSTDSGECTMANRAALASTAMGSRATPRSAPSRMPRNTNSSKIGAASTVAATR